MLRDVPHRHSHVKGATMCSMWPMECDKCLKKTFFIKYSFVLWGISCPKVCREHLTEISSSWRLCLSFIKQKTWKKSGWATGEKHLDALSSVSFTRYWPRDVWPRFSNRMLPDGGAPTLNFPHSFLTICLCNNSLLDWFHTVFNIYPVLKLCVFVCEYVHMNAETSTKTKAILVIPFHLELQAIMNHLYTVAEIWIWVLWKTSAYSLTTEPFLQPHGCYIFILIYFSGVVELDSCPFAEC